MICKARGFDVKMALQYSSTHAVNAFCHVLVSGLSLEVIMAGCWSIDLLREVVKLAGMVLTSCQHPFLFSCLWSALFQFLVVLFKRWPYGNTVIAPPVLFICLRHGQQGRANGSLEEERSL